MKLTLRIVGVLFGLYILIVIAFESLLGYYQPQGGNTIVITTYDGDEGADRVVTEIASDGQRYIAVNHWPRAWYYRLLDNPRVTVAKEDTVTEHVAVAVAVEGDEHDRVQADNPTGIVFRLLTGFPPRYFVRLDDA
ncbi:MAG: hypothetical protein CMQ05_04680 [Gammaproteobacteria bacterium]|nr:hypothetical protein [Gammaproteobacteria bacterium]RPG23560.1 MAG: hypothetical protein CBC10_014530 [Gammaproteobacteria bacterium TMED50]|tara:strand:+ start:725 stop:1132 length:408 start_codon:yes stop_codon:yes gene_type:complete